MGDNRDNSSDSRSWNDGRGGSVPLANVLGRVSLIWLPLDRMSFLDTETRKLPASLASLESDVARCIEQLR